MDEQLLITLVLIGLASAYLCYRSWRTWRSAKGEGCSGGCGCAKATATDTVKAEVLIPKLALRQKPERP